MTTQSAEPFVFYFLFYFLRFLIFTPLICGDEHQIVVMWPHYVINREVREGRKREVMISVYSEFLKILINYIMEGSSDIGHHINFSPQKQG